MFEQLGPGLKMGMEIEVWSENECGKYIFWSEIGSGFGELGAHPHQEFPGVTPPPPQPYHVQQHMRYVMSVRALCVPRFDLKLRPGSHFPPKSWELFMPKIKYSNQNLKVWVLTNKPNQHCV